MERQEQIHSKGFAMGNNFIHGGVGDPENPINYNKIKVGAISESVGARPEI